MNIWKDCPEMHSTDGKGTVIRGNEHYKPIEVPCPVCAAHFAAVLEERERCLALARHNEQEAEKQYDIYLKKNPYPACEFDVETKNIYFYVEQTRVEIEQGTTQKEKSHEKA